MAQKEAYAQLNLSSAWSSYLDKSCGEGLAIFPLLIPLIILLSMTLYIYYWDAVLTPYRYVHLKTGQVS